jgi:hypothetical protein
MTSRTALRPLALAAAIAALAAATSGCSGSKKTTPPTANAIDLTIDRGTAPSGIDHLDIDVAGLGMDITQTVRRPTGATEVALPDMVQIALPAGAKGTAMITAIARDTSNAELARGHTSGAFASPEVVSLAITLERTAASPDGGTAPHPDAGMLPPDDSGPGAANLTVDMPSIDFGDVIAGHSSMPTVLTVRNTGGSDSGPLSVSLGGDAANSFALGADGNCSGSKLSAGQSCAISISFMPDRSGALRATVEVAGTPGGDITVILTGSGLGLGHLMLVPSMNNFGSIAVGSAPATADFTAKNSGQSPTGTITVALGQAASDYTIAQDGCSRVSLASGASCTISVHFQPATAAVLTATLAVSAHPGGAQFSSLFGRGLVPAALTARPTMVDFGGVVTGQSASAAITITNSGQIASSALASSLGGQDSGEFAIAQDLCTGMALMPGASCTVTVQAHPSTTGAKQAGLTVSGAGSASVPLAVTGLAPGSLSITPTTDTFPGALLMNDGETHTYTVSNSGGGSTGALAISLNGSGASQYVITSDNCSTTSLSGGGTCTIGIRFHPTARGSQTASLVAGATPGGAVSSALSGNGLAPALLTGDASTASFGTIDVTRSSPPFTWTISNSGDVMSGPLQTSISGSSGDFAIMSSCTNGQPLAQGASCTIVLSFAPMSGGSKSLTVTVSGTPGGSAMLTATGTGREPVPLTVALAGNGAGTISSDTGGILCGTACSASYLYGTMVTLTASPQTGSMFSGWTGACSGTGSCVVSMTQAQSVSASFTLLSFPLAVTGVPDQASFSSTPALDCANGSCTGMLAYGTMVTLSGANNAPYNFNGFSGAGCTGTSCALTIAGNTTVTASYSLNSYGVTVTYPVGATLSTSSNPALRCIRGTCSGTLPYGTAVTLTAGDDPEYAFSTYSGGGCGTSPTCALTVQGTTSVTANYNLNSYTLTVTAGAGGSTAVNDLTGACAAGCSYPWGTAVTVSATPSGNWNFSAWTDDPNQPASRTVVVSGNTSLTASFSAIQVSLVSANVSNGGSAQLTGTAFSTSANAASSVTYSCSGTANNCPGSWTFDQGSEVVFTATPDPAGWFINPWLGNIGANVPSSATVVHISNVGTAQQGLNWIVPVRACFTGTFIVRTTWALIGSGCGRQDMAVPSTSGFNAIGVNFNPPIQ